MRLEYEVTKEDEALMAQYDIKVETRTLFCAEGYKYDNLKDALRYAKQSLEKRQTAVAD